MSEFFFISYRLIEAATHTHIGKLRIFQNNWDEAGKEFEQAIEIAKIIPLTQGLLVDSVDAAKAS